MFQDTRDDIGGAQNAGMLGILVKTGQYARLADENLFVNYLKIFYLFFFSTS